MTGLSVGLLLNLSMEELPNRLLTINNTFNPVQMNLMMTATTNQITKKTKGILKILKVSIKKENLRMAGKKY